MTMHHCPDCLTACADCPYGFKPIEETCSWCLGAGTVQGMGGRGPDTWDCDYECSRCGGTGALLVPNSTSDNTEQRS